MEQVDASKICRPTEFCSEYQQSTIPIERRAMAIIKTVSRAMVFYLQSDLARAREFIFWCELS